MFGDGPCSCGVMLRLSMPHSGYREAEYLQQQETNGIASRDWAGGQVYETWSGFCHNIVKTKPLLPDLSVFMRQQVLRQKYFPDTFVTAESVAVSEGTWESTPHCAGQCWTSSVALQLVAPVASVHGVQAVLFSPPHWQAGLCRPQRALLHSAEH